MPERRHYPPAKVLHIPHCIEGSELPALAIASVDDAIPNWRLHFCFPLEFHHGKSIEEIGIATSLPMVTFETVDYGQHIYRPDRSGRFPLPDDAIDFPCAVCGGTHGGELEELLGTPSVAAKDEGGGR